MKFYKLDEVPIRNDDLVFKASSAGRWVPFLIFTVLTLGLLLFGMGVWSHGSVSIELRLIAFGFAAFFGLLAFLSYAQFRASLKPTNWLLRCNGTGVIIKYRSFLNWRFPGNDIQAVGFDYSEITWARVVGQQRTVPALGEQRNTQSQHLTFLEFCLPAADFSELDKHLQAEQNLSPTGIMISRDYPVSVAADGVLQLRWTLSGQYSVRPSVQKAVEFLSRHVKILAADATKLDLTHQPGLKPGQEDAKILALAKSGDKIGAVQLARQTYGSNLSEAVAFVEKLQSGE